MKREKRKTIVAGVALAASAVYLVAPYFILVSVIKNAKTDVSGPEEVLRSFYYFAYTPLLKKLPDGFWYKNIIINRARALCKQYPDSCTKPEKVKRTD